MDIRKDISRDPIYIAILYYINEKQKVHPKELASRLKCSRQAVDYRLKNLENKGFVKKLYIDNKVFYTITDEGAKIIDKYSNEIHDKLMLNYNINVKSRICYVYNIYSLLKKLLRHVIIKSYIRTYIALSFLIIGFIGFIYHLIISFDYRGGLITLIFWIIISLIIYFTLSK